MSRQGWLVARREGNRAFYAVTERGRRRIEELSPRIYGPVIEWDGRWRLLSYAIGEAHRERRERLRKELAALGWAHALALDLDLARRIRSTPRARPRARPMTLDAIHLFAASTRAAQRSGAARALLGRRGDRVGLSASSSRATRPLLERERASAALSATKQRSSSASGSSTITASSPISIPGLPSELLPAHWPGTAAAALFREYYAALEAKSQRYFHLCASALNGGPQSASKRAAHAQTPD